MNFPLEIVIENFTIQYLKETLKSLEENLNKFLDESKIFYGNLEVISISR